MSAKILDSIQAIALPVASPSSSRVQARTYSISPRFLPAMAETSRVSPIEIESFLEAENPLGCFRGVMWVMAFNLAAVLLGLMIWQSCRLLF